MDRENLVANLWNDIWGQKGSWISNKIMVLSSAFSVKISQFSSRKDQKQGVRTPREVRVSSKIIEKSYKKISRHHELNKAHLKKHQEKQ